jgi:hypothetical protein
LRENGWRLLVSAAACLRHEGFKYALDNGAWTAYQQGRPFDERLFAVALRKMGAGADWTTLPDIVAGGLPSLEMSLRWMRQVLDESPRALLAVQDGMSLDDVRPFLGPRVGIFVGGSTEWKLRTMTKWTALAREVDCWCHIARVNSCKRILLCQTAGATSFDGSNASRFSRNTQMLSDAAQAMPVWGGKRCA